MVNGGAEFSVMVSGVSKSFGDTRDEVPVLRGVNLTVRPGEFVTIIGPSGCGKSTLFNIISGVVLPDKGRVHVNGEPANGRVGLVGYMPQKDLLMPWRTVIDNVILGMEVAGVSRQDARREALPLIAEFGLEGFESSYPYALSGGMRQRAAFLRTVLFKKDILLLDEPFGALDALTRQAMHEWLLGVWEKLGMTIVFVTHDVEEATFLSDRVYVMSARPGQIVAELRINLPRPRTYDLVVSEAFLRLKAHLLETLRGEGRMAGSRAP
jgi:ABC-type nitrate/sulfonate/bicarbonate transport system ATPase subunit